ncbi:protein Mis18-beta [Thalassophryne amazonica]|uniref:protein Mis18-beta n=1 Tax=Thalassophryne amazonica TaxID=390379 RepID=UPI0014719C58|nr:protein Mis18-beta [Thalassophryne amazonica]
MEFEESILVQLTDDMQLSVEAEAKDLMTFHCQRCNRVLGDSLSVCGELKSLDFLMCLKVTDDVIVTDEMEYSGHKGKLAHCIYSALKCRGCCSAVGKVVHSAPLQLAVIRSVFLLFKANINCYILNCGLMVTASSLSFDLKPLQEDMNEVKQTFEEQFDKMSQIKSRLSDGSTTTEMDK